MLKVGKEENIRGKRRNDKPGSVVGSYLSRRIVANTLKRSMSADLTACETYTIYFLLRTGFT